VRDRDLQAANADHLARMREEREETVVQLTQKRPGQDLADEQFLQSLRKKPSLGMCCLHPRMGSRRR
jgi:hypothetical protein